MQMEKRSRFATTAFGFGRSSEKKRRDARMISISGLAIFSLTVLWIFIVAVEDSI